jgi:hypothetical protein
MRVILFGLILFVNEPFEKSAEKNIIQANSQDITDSESLMG